MNFAVKPSARSGSEGAQCSTKFFTMGHNVSTSSHTGFLSAQKTLNLTEFCAIGYR